MVSGRTGWNMRLIHTADREGAECLAVHAAAEDQLVLIVEWASVLVDHDSIFL